MAIGFFAGCASDVQQFPTVPVQVASGAATAEDTHCRAVARDRANDALANGYGFQIGESIFQESYRDCMTWRAGKPD